MPAIDAGAAALRPLVVGDNAVDRMATRSAAHRGLAAAAVDEAGRAREAPGRLARDRGEAARHDTDGVLLDYELTGTTRPELLRESA